MWAVTGWIVGVLCRHNQRGYLIKNGRVAEMVRRSGEWTPVRNHAVGSNPTPTAKCYRREYGLHFG